MNHFPVIRTEHLSIGYTLPGGNDFEIVNNIHVCAGEGEMIAVLGKNGCGKSTLLRTLAHLQQPLGGRVYIHEKENSQYRLAELARKVSFVSTEPVRLHHMTVYELVALGRTPYAGWFGFMNEEDKQTIRRAMEEAGIIHLQQKHLDELSDGERQRAMIARTLAQDTPLILLDEPTAFLDVSNRYEIIHLLRRLSRTKNKTVIYSTHELNIALGESDQLWLFTGKEVVQGTPEDLVFEGKMARAFDSSQLHFDLLTGEFSGKQAGGKSVYVSSADRQLKEWTKRFFIRNGFVVSSSAKADMQVEVSRTEESICWKIQDAGREILLHGNFSMLQKNIKDFSGVKN